ncbi:MAG: hypothetical protein ACYTF4_13370 [Planctomycetota bacterium]|jgi:hypothetical protein
MRPTAAIPRAVAAASASSTTLRAWLMNRSAASYGSCSGTGTTWSTTTPPWAARASRDARSTSGTASPKLATGTSTSCVTSAATGFCSKITGVALNTCSWWRE